MVHKRADLHAVSQLRNSAHVVAMIVGDQEVIELFHACHPGRGHDAIGIPAVKSRPARVNEKGLTCRADD